MPRIGLLSWSPCDGESVSRYFGSLLEGLKEQGQRLGETVTIECRSAEGSYEGLSRAAEELARLSVDVIVSNSQPAGEAAYRVTRSIPIVTIVSGDPVAAGFAQNLARPGGNVTGLSYYATELTAKRLELLLETLPAVRTVGVIANSNVPDLPFEADTRRAAERLNISLVVQHVSEAEDLEPAFSRMATAGAEAVFVLPDLMFASEAQRIADLALGHRLPSMAWGGWFTRVGCLMAYSSEYDKMVRRLAFYVDRILKGASPGELPIEQPTTFRLSVNLRTAKAIGVEVPQSILLLADEVIE